MNLLLDMKEKNFKKKLDILHIYYGSQGTGGIYLDEIYNALKAFGFNQDVIVSYYYPFNYGKNIFFKKTDLASGMKKSKMRILFRLFEFIYGMLYTFFYILYHKPKVVNYSLNRGFITDVYFVSILKRLSSSKIMITCHDVIPFSNNEQDYRKQVSYRRAIFSKVDFLLVHNEKSIEDLQRIFDVDKDRIHHHPFPIMDLNRINNDSVSFKKKFDFAFVGHLRKEKGLELLIDAWNIFYENNPNATLLIAGNAAYDIELFSTLKNKNTTIVLKYLSDSEYCKFINESKTIILPYLKGTNSGVLFNIIASDCNIIYSNLPMFEESILLSKIGSFETGNIESLVSKLSYFYKKHEIQHANLLKEYKRDFDIKVVETYKKIMYANKK
ncbi:glycosyltransferase [Empedobacter sp.]|uniref:glycosyltransferase n=1 Tax=Empedobacter sp. TaxID=1927715 RepID=UPI0028AED3C7|nr:glycosyltransferase [Empedobacter sp.]